MSRLDPHDRFTIPAVRVPVGNAYTLAECTDGNGVTTLWLLDDSATGDNSTSGCARACCAPHERAGQLPREVSHRLGLVQRCGQPTRAGKPCRVVVHQPGDACAMHSRTRA